MALYSRTRAAINTGYGLPPLHPEYYFGGPYGNPPHRVKGGKSMLKHYRGGNYSTAAMEGYGYNTAALEGYGESYNNAALRGYGESYNNAALHGYGGSYNNAALYGYGIGEVLSTMADAIGPTAMSILEKLAKQFSTNVANLIKDPERLMSILQEYAPKIAGVVKKFFDWLKRKQGQVDATVDKVKEVAEKANDVATKVMGEPPKDTCSG